MVTEDAKMLCSYTVAVFSEIRPLLQQRHLPRLDEIACLGSVRFNFPALKLLTV